MSRSNSRINRVNQESNRNKSNSNPALLNKTPSNGNLKQNHDSQKKIVPGLKILGQEREVTEDELFRESGTPISNRSSNSSRPASSASRATPSKQVSLQAVKRKEDKPEEMEPIDWNEFNKALSLKEERVLPPMNEESDSDDDEEYIVPRRVLSPEEEQALVEQRAREMASALDSSRLDKNELVLSARLEEIEKERELQEKKEKEREEEMMKAKLISDNDSKYSNDHYINMSARDEKNKISKSFILGKDSRQGTAQNEEMLIGKKPAVRKGENVIGKHVMDRPQETAVGAVGASKETDESEKVFVTEVKSESGKKNEASAKDESSSDEDSDDDDEEEDFIGEKGKAPNQLLMEFVTCLMEKDYENAEKLCKMILVYEPDNKEALTFFPLIQEKREQDADEGGSGEESTDSGEEEADDDDDDDNDESGDDDDDSDDEDDDDDDDDDDEDSSDAEDSDNEGRGHADSGIASANSD